MRKIVELDTQSEKYTTLTITTGETKDVVKIRIGKNEVTVDTIELVDALVMFEPSRSLR